MIFIIINTYYNKNRIVPYLDYYIDKACNYYLITSL